jgi:glycosyltransferase involved in cell wall biosynthesis
MSRRMRVLVVTVQVPFVRGGAEAQAEGLVQALREAGHEAEIVALPFKWYPPERILDHMLACRLLDLTESCGTTIDRVVALKFPAYLVPHPNKVLWILHQHRTAYELWDSPLGDLIHFPNGLQVRDAIRQADRQHIAEARAVFTDSANVARRLKKYCGLDAEPLYHPPHNADAFYWEPPEDYVFCPSRLALPKRQELVLRAMARTSRPVHVRFAGAPDVPAYADQLQDLARRLKVDRRVRWLGLVSEEEKRRLYAGCLGVVFPPVDEDYGYITLEAMLSSKPVITCTDSGGPLEFVRDRATGLVAEPTPEGLAAAMDRLWAEREAAVAWGKAARAEYDRRDIRWATVVRRLTA